MIRKLFLYCLDRAMIETNWFKYTFWYICTEIVNVIDDIVGFLTRYK